MNERDRAQKVRRLFVAGVSLMSAVALVTGGLAEGAQKKKKPKPASLSMSVPAQVKVGKHYDVKFSGHSGKFNELTFYIAQDPCAKTKAAEGQFHSGYRWDLKPHKDFKRQAGFKSNAPGKRYLCGYLWQLGKPGATDQKHKSKTYQVVP